MQKATRAFLLHSRTRIRFLLATAALVALFSRPAFPAEDAVPQPKRVLYLNSYHKGYRWSDEEERGFLARIREGSKDAEVSFEYLDSMRFDFEKLAPSLAESLSIKYALYRPQVIVTADNRAYDFIAAYRNRLFPGVPVVFCGYNNFSPDILKETGNVTGVNEENDVRALVALALRIQPELTTLAFIASTADETNRRLYDSVVRDVFPTYRTGYNLVVLKDETAEEIRSRLELLPRTTAVFLTGQTVDTENGRPLTSEQSASLITQMGDFPCYTFWDFHLGNGALGGTLITGYDQGAAAGDLALQILAGKPASSIPVLMKTPVTVTFDWERLVHFRIRESTLPAGSVILNQPRSPWAVWPLQVGGMALLILSQTAAILMLLRIVSRRRRELAEAEEKRIALEKRAEERMAELTAANERLKIASETDPLTALANRRAFSRKLDQEFARQKRAGGLFSLIMLDIDHFKRFNDTYGHLEGDECLIKVAAVVADAVRRPYDLAARFGGEEFIAVLPETGMDGALKVARRIHEGVLALKIPHATSETNGYVTVSVGVVTAVPFRAEKPLSLVDMVDGVMYRAKNSGRNRIETADLSRETENAGNPT